MRFTRTRHLLGEEQFEKLQAGHVTVCGLGGVGSYAVETLARAGVGHLRLVDFDVVNPSNINRQLFALDSTVGQLKTEIAARRVLDINPDCQVEVISRKVDEHSEAEVLADPCNVLIDAIDSLSSKVHLIANARTKHIHVISSMGAAGRLDPNQVYTVDLSETHTCPLARFVRRKLHRKNIYDGVRCVFSPEVSDTKDASNNTDNNDAGTASPVLGSISYVTAVFGLKAGYEAISYLLST